MRFACEVLAMSFLCAVGCAPNSSSTGQAGMQPVMAAAQGKDKDKDEKKAHRNGLPETVNLNLKHLTHTAPDYDCWLITVSEASDIFILTSAQPAGHNDGDTWQITPASDGASNQGGRAPNISIDSGWLYMSGYGIRVGTGTVAAMSDSSKLVVQAPNIVIHTWHHFDDQPAYVWIPGNNAARASAISTGYSRWAGGNMLQTPPGDPVNSTDPCLLLISETCRNIRSTKPEYLWLDGP